MVMTRNHRSQVIERVAAVEKRVYLLKEFISGVSDERENLDVSDPIGKPRGSYKECLSEIKEAIHKIKDLV